MKKILMLTFAFIFVFSCEKKNNEFHFSEVKEIGNLKDIKKANDCIYFDFNTTSDRFENNNVVIEVNNGFSQMYNSKSSLRLSPDKLHHMFYTEVKKKDSLKEYLVVDAKIINYDNPIEYDVNDGGFAPDSKNIWYTIRSGDDKIFFIYNYKGAVFSDIKEVYGKDNINGFAYKLSKKNGKNFLYFNNGIIENTEYDRINDFNFLDKNKYIYIGNKDKSEYSHDKFLVESGVASQTVEKYFISNDKKNYIYSVRSGDEYSIYLNGKKIFDEENETQNFLYAGSERYLYVSKKDDKYFLEYNSGKIGPFKYFSSSDISVSPDGSLFYFVATDFSGKYCFYINDKKFHEYENINYIHLDAGKKKYFFIGKKENKLYYLTNDFVSEDYDALNIDAVDDFKNYYCIASRNGRQFVIYNGKKSEEFDKVASYNYWNKHFYFIAKKSDEYYAFFDNEKIFTTTEDIKNIRIYNDNCNIIECERGSKSVYYIIYNKKKFGPYRYLATQEKNENLIICTKEDDSEEVIYKGELLNLQFIDLKRNLILDGKLILIMKNKDGKYFYYDNGKVSDLYDNLGIETSRENGKNYFFVAESNKENSLIYNGKKSNKSFSYLIRTVWSSDEKNFAAVVIENEKQKILKNGEKISNYEFDEIGNLVFSENGEHLFYMGNLYSKDYKINSSKTIGVESFFILDDKKFNYKSYDMERQYFYYGVGFPYFKGISVSNDGRHFFLYNSDSINSFVDGKEYSNLEFLTFSPDGRQYAFQFENNGKKYVMLNGVKSSKESFGVVWSESEKNFKTMYLENKNTLKYETVRSGK